MAYGHELQVYIKEIRQGTQAVQTSPRNVSQGLLQAGRQAYAKLSDQVLFGSLERLREHAITQRIHVWYICKHWGYIDGKCYHIWHTWILWVMLIANIS